jgi:hypothetical protein
MGLIDWLRRLFQPSALSGTERARAARLGVYFIEASGFDQGERTMFSRTSAVCFNAVETADRMRSLSAGPDSDDIDYKQWGPRPLLDLLEGRKLTVPEARILLARAARGEPHEWLPEPLSDAERAQAANVQIHLIWYEDKFHYGNDRDSFATTVCLSREEAEAEYKRGGRRPAESGGDGYEIVGPCPLSSQPPEVVREVMRRLHYGLPGPVPIPSKYW